MLDLVIIGGAAAGCSAAIYAARRQLNFRIIAQNVGGEVALSGTVNNWPGIQEIQGFELAQKLAEHVKSYGIKIEEGFFVEEIRTEKNYHIVVTKSPNGKTEEIKTKTVIVSTGIHPRHLEIAGEKEYLNKGVTYCTVCDGPLFRNKATVTVGSGNSALESALMMANIAKPAYVISKFPDSAETQGGFPKGEKILIDKVKSNPNVKIIYQAEVKEIVGTNKVEGVKYLDSNGQEQILNADGIMVHVGMIPNSGLVKNVEKNKQGEIMVDNKCRTNIPGIFASGDVTNIPYKQIAIAAGQGIVAALSAIEHINMWTEK